MRRLTLAFEGILAGGAFALADALACGLPSDTLLPWWIVVSGLVLGLLGAIGGALLNRPGGGTATVVLAAHGLQWCAIVSKEWFGVVSQGRALELLALVVVSAFAAALATFLLVRATLRVSATLLAPALVPASSLIETLFPYQSWLRIAIAFLPAVVLGLLALVAGRMAPRRGPVVIPALVLLLVVAAFVPGVTEAQRVAIAAPPAATKAPEAEAPNLLLVIVDTLRADHVRGGPMAPDRPATPALDRLAAEGIEFTQAVSSAPWTLPSHGSLFTSRVPADHGAVTSSRRIDSELPTLAGVLHDHGYATAAFTGGGFVVPATGLATGFEEFDARAESFDHALVRHTPLLLRIARNRFARLWPVVNSVPRSGGLALVAGEVDRWLEKRDRRRPFFVVAHTYQVHDYYVYQADWDAPELSISDARPRFAGRFKERLAVEPHQIATVGTTPEEAEAFRRIYAHRVEIVDAALGDLVDRARARSDERRLVVVVTSDHGEGFDAESRRFTHGGRLHDDLLRVPLFVSAPGLLPVGQTVDAQVSLVDVMPTLLELAGVTPPEHLEGVSLCEVVRGDETSRPAWSEDGVGSARKVAVRTPGWKVMKSGELLEVFDLAADPLERMSVPDSVPRALHERLDALMLAHPLEAGSSAEFDAATREQLRLLGYVR